MSIQVGSFKYTSRKIATTAYAKCFRHSIVVLLPNLQYSSTKFALVPYAVLECCYAFLD
jgi:hypothetical protein